MNRIRKFITILSCVVFAVSCSATPSILDANKHDLIDPDVNLSRDDYRDMHSQKPAAAAKLVPPPEPPVPDLAEVLAVPQPPKLGETKLVSIAVTDDVPLKDVLIELARLADVDIEVDAGISGGVSFRAKDRPFNEVIDRITDLAGLRYTMKNSVLRVERDTPYVQDYPINFLNIDRTTNGNFNVNSNGSGGSSSSSGGSSGGTSGGSSGGSTGGSGGSTGTGSSSSVTQKSDSDFWKQFEESIKQILTYSATKRISSATIEKQPDAPDAPAGAAPQVAPVQAPAPQVSADGKINNGSFYIMNRQASTLTVSATDKQHDMIKRFLRMVEANTSAQVLIEAKVLEVTLNETYQSGINWSNFGGKHVKFTGDFDAVTSTNTAISAPSMTLVENDLFSSGLNLSAAVRLLNEFGTTRALSSPRLHAMNNQQAVLSFAQGIVYFNVKISTTDAILGTNGQVVTPSKVDVSSSQQTVPIGITLSLQPSIDSKENEVTLSIRPTLTRLVKFVDDPGFEVSKADALSKLSGSAAATLATVTSQIPEVETRELDSIVKIKSGQTLVIGGLLEDNVANNDSGVPGASEVPWLGNLFKSVSKTNTRKELVIFIRATIVPTTNSLDKSDKTLYEKFGNDPRPINYNPQ